MRVTVAVAREQGAPLTAETLELTTSAPMPSGFGWRPPVFATPTLYWQPRDLVIAPTNLRGDYRGQGA